LSPCGFWRVHRCAVFKLIIIIFPFLFLRAREGMSSAIKLKKEEGNAAYKAKKFADAVALYSEAISSASAMLAGGDVSICTVLAECLHNRGQCYVQSDRNKDALLDFADAATANPTYVKAYLSAAFVHEKVGRPELAAAVLRGALKLVSSPSDAVRIQERLATLPTPPPEPHVVEVPSADLNRADMCRVEHSTEEQVHCPNADSKEAPEIAALRTRLESAGCAPLTISPPSAVNQRFDTACVMARYARAGLGVGDM
jgi:tetratricopeptide (TPR) repeat protein